MKVVLTFGQRLKQKRLNAGLTQEELGKLVGATKSAVSQWEKGIVENIEGKYLLALSKVFKESVESLTNAQYLPLKKPTFDLQKRVPLISWIKAGEWCEAIDLFETGDAEDWLPCPSSHSPNTYALRVKGDSMTAPYPGMRSYPEGVIIFVDPDKAITNGCRVIAKLPNSNEATFKEYREDGGKRYLKPLNPQYQIYEITGETMLCGVVIGKYEPE